MHKLNQVFQSTLHYRINISGESQQAFSLESQGSASLDLPSILKHYWHSSEVSEYNL